MIEAVDQSLDNVLSIRGSHIHEGRYSDESLDRLQAWELLAGPDANDESGKYHEFFFRRTYKDIWKEWSERIRNNNRETQTLLDLYFKVLDDILFDKNENIRF